MKPCQTRRAVSGEGFVTSAQSMLLPALFGGVDFVVASLCTPLITACSIAGGIGGGGLLVPLYSVVLGLGSCREQPHRRA